LSNCKVTQVSFRQVKFEACKVLGVHFNTSNPFLLELIFQNCQLDYCNFYSLKLKKSVFKDCRMREVDFSQADLSGCDLLRSDLAGAIFDRSILEKADLREAVNYRIDPETNRIKGARFDLEGLPGLLGKYGIKIG
jgi:fluoroquinolone resistance protein